MNTSGATWSQIKREEMFYVQETCNWDVFAVGRPVGELWRRPRGGGLSRLRSLLFRLSHLDRPRGRVLQPMGRRNPPATSRLPEAEAQRAAGVLAVAAQPPLNLSGSERV